MLGRPSMPYFKVIAIKSIPLRLALSFPQMFAQYLMVPDYEQTPLQVT